MHRYLRIVNYDELVRNQTNVTPAVAGVQTLSSHKRGTTKSLIDSRFRGNDKLKRHLTFYEIVIRSFIIYKSVYCQLIPDKELMPVPSGIF
jgi:hypothetical protein